MTKDIIEKILDEKYPNRNKYADMDGHYSDGEIGDEEVVELILFFVAIAEAERDRSWRERIERLRQDFKPTVNGEYTFGSNMKVIGYNQALDDLLSDTKTNEK